MSFKKETVSTVDLIRLYYKTDDIYNEVSEITAFKASNVVTKDGSSDFDRVQISTDEKRHLKQYIKKAVLEVFDLLFKVLGEQDLFFTSEITVDAATFEASGGYILDNARYRSVNLNVLDVKIQEAVVNYVLKEWYFLKGLPDDSALHMAKFNQLKNEISARSLTFRLPV